MRDGLSTWLIEDNAQVHPEGADSGAHKGEGLRVESLRKVALVLEVRHPPLSNRNLSPQPPHCNLQQQILEVKSGLMKFEQEVLD